MSEPITQNDIKTLARSSLFAAVPVPEIRRLLDAVRCTVLRRNAGAIVAFRGDAYERLLIVTSGTLSAEIVDAKGKVLKMESLRAPSVVAGGILFAEESALPVQLRAETDVRLLSFPRRAVLELCRQSQTFLEAFLRDAGNRITFLAEKIYLFRFSTLRQKIAGYFLELHDRQGTPFLTLPYSIETLAELFGVSRPSLSRSLSELVEEGVLARNERSYAIADPARLEALLEG